MLGNHCLTRTETTLAGYSKQAIAQLLSEKINQRYLTNMKASHPHCPKFLSKRRKPETRLKGIFTQLSEKCIQQINYRASMFLFYSALKERADFGVYGEILTTLPAA